MYTGGVGDAWEINKCVMALGLYMYMMCMYMYMYVGGKQWCDLRRATSILLSSVLVFAQNKNMKLSTATVYGVIDYVIELLKL